MKGRELRLLLCFQWVGVGDGRGRGHELEGFGEDSEMEEKEGLVVKEKDTSSFSSTGIRA